MAACIQILTHFITFSDKGQLWYNPMPQKNKRAAWRLTIFIVDAVESHLIDWVLVFNYIFQSFLIYSVKLGAVRQGKLLLTGITVPKQKLFHYLFF